VNHKFIFFSELRVYFEDMNESDLDKAFHAALSAEILKGGRGAQARLAKKVGLTPTYITRLLKSKAYGSEQTRRKIARVFGYEYEEFLDLGREEKAQQRNSDVPEGDYYSAPLVEGRIAAGSGGLVSPDQIKSKVWIYAPALRERRQHRLTAVQVSEKDGESMLPTIGPDDIVLIDHHDPGGVPSHFKSGKIYAVRTDRLNSDTAIKRVYRSNGNLVLASDNRAYPPIVAWSNDISELIIGRVVWGWRDLLKA